MTSVLENHFDIENITSEELELKLSNFEETMALLATGKEFELKNEDIDLLEEIEDLIDSIPGLNDFSESKRFNHGHKAVSRPKNDGITFENQLEDQRRNSVPVLTKEYDLSNRTANIDQGDSNTLYLGDFIEDFKDMATKSLETVIELKKIRLAAINTEITPMSADILTRKLTQTLLGVKEAFLVQTIKDTSKESKEYEIHEVYGCKTPKQVKI